MDEELFTEYLATTFVAMLTGGIVVGFGLAATALGLDSLATEMVRMGVLIVAVLLVAGHKKVNFTNGFIYLVFFFVTVHVSHSLISI